MITLEEYANLAGRVYYHENSNYFNKKYTPIVHSKIDAAVMDWRQISDITQQPQFSENFYAALFVKFVQGRPTDAVVSIRGTVLSKTSNLLVDTEAWISDVIGNGKSLHVPAYLHLAQRFFSAAKNYMRQNFSANVPISLTGHSLGAALAQLIVTQYGIHYPCVTFNSPGVGEIVSKTNFGSYITNVNAVFGVINKIGTPVPDSYTIWVDVPNYKNEAKLLFQHFSKRFFEQSNKIYNLADKISSTPAFTVLQPKIDLDAVAFSERVLVYLHALPSLGKTKSYDIALRKCETKNRLGDNIIQKIFSLPENVCIDLYCRDKAIFADAFNTISAQHSIDNMLLAIKARPALANWQVGIGNSLRVASSEW